MQKGPVVWVILLAACVRPTSANAPTAEQVANIFGAYCRHCHEDPPLYGAPMSLATLDAFRADDGRGPLAGLALARVRSNGADHMPPEGHPQPTPDERAALVAWLGNEARPTDAIVPPATHHDDAPSPAPPETETDFCEVVTPSMATVLAAGAQDTHVCYGISIPPRAEKRHILSIEPLIDNAELVHHVGVVITPTPLSSTPSACPGLAPAGWQSIYGWTPGGESYLAPEEAAFPIAANQPMHLGVQVHLTTKSNPMGGQDATAVRVCHSTRLRAFDAGVMIVGGTAIAIPPGRRFELVCQFPYPNPEQAGDLTLVAALPHMHLLGEEQQMTLVHSDGSEEVLLDQRHWDYSHVRFRDVHAVLRPGETIRTRCQWYNPGPTQVGFGQTSADEMCFGVLTYYPLITASYFGAMTPIFYSSCSGAVLP